MDIKLNRGFRVPIKASNSRWHEVCVSTSAFYIRSIDEKYEPLLGF